MARRRTDASSIAGDPGRSSATYSLSAGDTAEHPQPAQCRLFRVTPTTQEQTMQDEKSVDEEALQLEREFDEAMDNGGGLDDLLKSDSDTGEDPEAGSQPAGDDDPGDGDEAGTQAKAEPEPTAKEAPDTTDTPDGVLARDGKNVIPYRVLEETRKRADRAEREAQEARQQAEERAQQRERELEQLRQQLAEQAQAKGDEVNTKGDPLEGLDEDQYPPDLVNAIRSLHKSFVSAQRELSEMKRREQERADQQQHEVKSVVQREIDANPDLASWQSEGGDVWQTAVAIDQRLQQSPRWADKSISERFAKVAQLTKAELDLQDAPPPAGKPVADKAPPQKPAAKARPDHDGAPAGISDIPGGSAPAQTEQEDLDGMSPQALEARMAKMSNEDIEAMLSRYG